MIKEPEKPISIGDKLTWVTIFNDKIQFMRGEVIDIVGDSMKVIGENLIGEKLSDLIGKNDKSIKWTNSN